MDSFQRFAPQARFQPRAVADVASALDKESQRRLSDLQRQQGQEEQRAQNRIVDSQQPNRTMEALSQFSQTASKFVEDYAKRTAKDIEVGSQFDSIYNPTLSSEEETIVNAATVQQQTAGQAANALEAEGDDIGAENLRADLNRVGQGLQDEKALLTSARTNYAGDVLAIVNGNEQLSRMFAEDPGRAMELATKIFIEQNGLQYTTKRNFVDIMGGTIRNVIQNTTTSQMTRIIKEKREQNLAENDGNTARVVSEFLAGSDAYNDGMFQGLSDTYLYDNNGVLTRGAANRRAATTLLVQAANTGNPDAVAAVGRTNTNGQNTAISKTYPLEFSKAINDAEKRRRELKRQRREAILEETGELLASTPPEARQQMLAGQLGLFGNDLQGRLQFEQQYGALSADPNSVATYQKYLDQIAEGQAFPPERIDELRANDQITTQQATKLKTESKKLVDRTLSLGKSDIEASKSRFDNNLTRVTGLAIDPATNFIISTKDVTPLTATQARNISKSFKRDQQLFVRTKIEQMNVGEMSLEERANVVRDLSDQYYKEQTQSPDGKYWLGGAFTQSGKVQPDSDEFELIRIDANLFGTPVTPRADSGVKNWSVEWTPASGVANIKGQYQPGDILFSVQDTKNLGDQLGKTGIGPEIGEIAQQLNMTPLQLLQDSGAAYNIPMNPANDGQVGAAVEPPANWKPYQSKNKPIYAKLIPLLLGQGYTPQGAAALVAVHRVRTVLAYKDGNPDGSIDTWGSTTKGNRDPLKNVITRLNTLADEDPIFSDPKTSVRQLERFINASGVEGHPYGKEIRELLRLAGYEL